MKIIHYHLFKNGGTTLDWILSQNYGTKLHHWHGDQANSTLTTADLLAYLAKAKDCAAITSHHLRFPVPENADSVFPVVFLRHPVDRVASIYEHERRQTFADKSDPKFLSLAAWLQDAIQNRPCIVCDAQVVYFADGGVYYEPPDRLGLKRAVDALMKLPFCGLVHKYDLSMTVLEDLIRRFDPDFSGAFFPQNISIGRHSSLEARLEVIRDEIGMQLFDHIYRNNLYDIELCRIAEEKLQTQFNGLTDGNLKREDLVARCHKLR